MYIEKHFKRQFSKPSKMNNVFVLLWRWIREKYRQRHCQYLPSVLLPELKRIEPSFKPKDQMSGRDSECVDYLKRHIDWRFRHEQR